MENKNYLTPEDIDYSNCVEDDFEGDECCPRGSIDEYGFCTKCKEKF